MRPATREELLSRLDEADVRIHQLKIDSQALRDDLAKAIALLEKWMTTGASAWSETLAFLKPIDAKAKP